jgi:hypothetical protein
MITVTLHQIFNYDDKMEEKIVGHIANMAEVTNSSEMLMESPERKRPLGRPKRR